MCRTRQGKSQQTCQDLNVNRASINLSDAVSVVDNHNTSPWSFPTLEYLSHCQTFGVVYYFSLIFFSMECYRNSGWRWFRSVIGSQILSRLLDHSDAKLNQPRLGFSHFPAFLLINLSLTSVIFPPNFNAFRITLLLQNAIELGSIHYWRFWSFSKNL